MTTPNDEATAEWPAPGEDDTDPVGFAPIYQPPGDPFVDDDFPATGSGFDPVELPGWNAPPAVKVGRRRLAVVAGIFLFLAVAVGAILVGPKFVGGPARSQQARSQAAGTAAPGGGAAAPGPVTAPVGGRTTAAFELVDGAASVRVRAGDLGDDLFQISTPDGSGVAPRVESGGDDVRLFLPAGAHGGPTSVEIVLNTSVRWTLRLHGGTQQTQVDLSGAQIDAVDLEGGANRIDLTLPAPRGLMVVRMTGGVDQFLVRLAGATPVRVRVQSGAGKVTLAGATHTGIAPGKSFTAYGWGDGSAGVDLLAVAGMSALTVEP
jgi:hypothetical protein